MSEADTKLVALVKESNLEPSKALVLTTQFGDFFALAADWEMKAKALVVTDPSQVAEMKMAREGRLFLKHKRVDIENTRKRLKEESLREGKAIDGIANVLKALIAPIEEHLEAQETFVVRMEQERIRKEQEALAAKAAAEVEAKRIADEKAEKERLARLEEENRRIAEENRRLREEAAVRNRAAEEERAKLAEAERRAREAEWKRKQEEQAALARLHEARAATERAEREALQKQQAEQARLDAMPDVGKVQAWLGRVTSALDTAPVVATPDLKADAAALEKTIRIALSALASKCRRIESGAHA